MYKLKKQRFLSTLTLVFALMLTVSAVYAATSGSLTFNGSATFGTELELRIVPITYMVGLPNLSRGTMQVSTDGQIATIEATIINPGETVEFIFYLHNTGAVDARIESITETSDFPVILSGNYTSLQTVVVAVGNMTPEYRIVVGWDANHSNAKGEFSFTVTMNYSINH
jgi:hypothetical protein